MKKKILFVHDKLGLFGGAEQMILSTAQRLKDHYSLSYLYSETTNNQEDRFHEAFEECSTEFSSFKPDLIYIHKCLSIPTMEKLLNSAVPTLHMVHDHEGYCLRGSKYFPFTQKICDKKAGLCCLFPGFSFLQRNPEGKMGIHWKNLSEWKKLIALDQQCTHFQVASEYMKETLVIQGYDADKISVLFGVPSLNSPEITRNENHIVYAGQITRGKGLDHLLRALKKVTAPFKLTVLGEGPFKQTCQRLAKKLNLSQKVDFKGFVPQEELAEIYQTATLGVVPSVWPEPFGMVGVEMLQHALPVIAFDSGGISEWLKDGFNGYLVPHLDTNTLANKIELLLRNPSQSKAFGKNGQAFVNDRFNFDRYINDLATLFETLTNVVIESNYTPFNS